MSIHIDGKKITAMYWGGLKIREAWYEGQRVFSGKPVEVMPPTPNWYGAQDWLRGRLTEYGESYQTVKEIPFEIDTGESSNLDSMFRGCSSLTTVPDMDTRNVALMYDMFRDCSSLTDGNVRLIGKRTGVNTARMIRDSGLTREPFYDINGQPI